MFFRLITISIQNLAWNEICLHIKRYSCFTVVHIFSFLHSMTFDLISGLHMQIQTWHPPLWLCTHAKYYVKSGLTNVLKNANKTKNMHLFSIRIANYHTKTYVFETLSNVQRMVVWRKAPLSLSSLAVMQMDDDLPAHLNVYISILSNSDMWKSTKLLPNAFS